MADNIPELSARPDAGDVLFTRGKSWFSRVTTSLTGPAAHQATAYSERDMVEANARSGRIERVAWSVAFERLAAAHSEWILYHWIRPAMNPRLRCMVQCDLLEAVDFERYSHIELPLQGLDVLVNRILRRRERQGYDAMVFRRLGDIWGNGVICSKTSNRPLIRNGFIPKSSGLEYGSPSDTYRWMQRAAAEADPAVRVIGQSAGWDTNGA